MGASTDVINTTPGNTQTFQNLMYQAILNAKKPNTSTPEYGRSAAFTPSTDGRRMSGGVGYTPFTGRSPMDALGRPVNDGLGYPIDYNNTGAWNDLGGKPPRTLPGVAAPTNSFPPELAALFSGGGMNATESAAPYTGGSMNATAQRRPAGTTTVGGVTYPTNGGYRMGPGDTASTNPDGSPRTAQPRGAGEGGMQSVIDFLNQMFTGMPASTPGVAIAGLPTYDTALAGAASMNAPTLGTLTRRAGETDAEFNTRGAGFNAEQGQFRDLLAMIQGSAGSDATSNTRGTQGGPATAITAPTFSSEGTQTQSADQIAQDTMGENSMFTNNILPMFNDLFTTQNELAAATAKEQAGNLTGSGFANTLGTALNRNTSSQQALLSNVLQNLVSQEIGRQGAGAQLASARNLAQGQGELTASVTSAQLAAQAQQLEQQARASGRSDLMAAANTLNQRAIQQANMEQQGALTNAGFTQQANIFNAGEENAANSQYFQAGANRNSQQADLDATRQNLIYNTSANTSQANSQQLMQLLQLLFGGGAQNTAVTSGGAGAMIPGLAQILTTIMMGA